MLAEKLLPISKGGGVKDTYFKNTTLLLHGDGTNGAQNNTFVDSSSNNFTITRNGNTTQGSFSPYGDNWSNYFSGTTSFFYMTSSTALVLYNTSFTLEAWVFLTGGSGYRTVVSKRTGAYAEYEIGVDPSGYFYFYTSSIYATTTLVPDNQWVHLAVSYDGTNLRFFQNGVLTKTQAGVGAANGTANLAIGAEGGSGSQTFTGYISNARITKGGALYTSAFTPSTVPLTTTVSSGTVSFLSCKSNRLVDVAGNATFIYPGTPCSVQAFSPFAPSSSYSTTTNGGSAYFDGSGDYLAFPAGSAFAPGLGTFTVEGWYYATATSGSQIMWAQTVSGSNYFMVQFDSSSSQFTFLGLGYPVYSPATVKPNCWNHFAVVRDATNITVYANGVAGSPVAFGSGYNFNNTTYVPVMSGYTHSQTNMMTGYLSNFRYVNGAVVYSGNFTPPTKPLATSGSASAASYPSTTNVNTSFASSACSLLTNFTNAAIYDNTGKNDLETVGNAQISTTQSKYGGASMYFDGTGDQLTVATNPMYKFGTGDFTVECWVYANSFSSSPCIVDGRPSGTAVPWAFYINSSGYPYFYDGGSLTSSIAVSATTWTHIAASRSSGTLKIFVNGVQGYSAANTTDMAGAGLQIGGAWSSSYLNGYIDDLRITKGYARYTANFTPPAAALPDQ